MRRGDIYDVEWPGAGRHPAGVINRDVAISALTNVTVVLITSTVRGLRTEVSLGPQHGLDHECVANCDNILTVPKRSLGRLRGHLDLITQVSRSMTRSRSRSASTELGSGWIQDRW